MPNWLTKRNENWTVLQNYNSITRVSTTYLRLRPSYLYKNDDPPSALDFRSLVVQLESNCGSCRAVITTALVEQFMTVVHVGQLATSWARRGDGLELGVLGGNHEECPKTVDISPQNQQCHLIVSLSPFPLSLASFLMPKPGIIMH